MSKGKVLFVLTSHDKLFNGELTGWYLPEAAHPYYVISKEYEVVWASPKGGEAPLDPHSVDMFKEDPECQRFLADNTAQNGVKNTLKLSDIDDTDYKAIFYVGGHGPMYDLATDSTNIALAERFYQSGRPVAAVCHGPGALVNVKDQEGKSIFRGRKATGFSNEEEEIVKLTDQVPFLLETKMVEIGAQYTKPKPFEPHVEVDGTVLTGANPASAGPIAKALLALLSSG